MFPTEKSSHFLSEKNSSWKIDKLDPPAIKNDEQIQNSSSVFYHTLKINQISFPALVKNI